MDVLWTLSWKKPSPLLTPPSSLTHFLSLILNTVPLVSGKGDSAGIFSISYPNIFIREMACCFLHDAVNTHRTGLEKDVSSLQVLGKFGLCIFSSERYSMT